MAVTRSYNSPDNIGSYFLMAIRTHDDCPYEFVTDLGTENKIMASMQACFWDDENALRYLASPRNWENHGANEKKKGMTLLDDF